jgi:putative restriction endonuclease
VSDAQTTDRLVRLAAHQFLEGAERQHGTVLPYEVLLRGFEFDGVRVPLIGPQGIFKPRVLPEMPLSVSTAPPVHGKPAPYADRLTESGLLEYCYRGTDAGHRDNVGLRKAMERRVPLVYLHGLVRGRYAVAWPVYVVGDDPRTLRFSIEVDDAASLEGLASPATLHVESNPARRAYLTVATRKRLHQQAFREQVLAAYRRVCAVCRLRRDALLDAAHILPDTHPRGDPVVPNGFALCKLHHAAFDGDILGVTPDLKVEIRADVLREADGPMLVHGIQGFDGATLCVPKSAAFHPDRDRVAERYEEFRRVG